MNAFQPRTGLRVAALVFAVAFVAPAHALTWLVGAGDDCDTANLQEAVDDAMSHAGEDSIRIANDQSYESIDLDIGQQDLTITGGYASCTAALPAGAVPTGSTILSGSGGAQAAVVNVTGSGVRVLSNLQIRNGDNVSGSGCGGGIRFTGRGQLRLRDTGISQNDANAGGGICVIPNGSPTFLTLESGVSIVNNDATSLDGGGIYLTGTMSFYALDDQTLIAFNRAAGDGGGIYAGSPAKVFLGAPSVNGTGPLYGNEAQRGGAIAAISEEGSEVNGCVAVFSTDATRPTRIHNNRASSVGGAVFMRTNQDAFGGSFARMYVHDAWVDGNTAPNGAVAFLSGDDVLGIWHGSTIEFNPATNDICGETTTSVGRETCTGSTNCNKIENNASRDFNGNATNGNIIELRDDSTVRASRVVMRNNTGTRLISWSGDGGHARLEDCALVDNTNTQELIRGFTDGYFVIDQCTVANNTIGASHVFKIDQGGDQDLMTNLLVDQPGKLTLSNPDIGSINFTNQWIIATDTTTLKPDPTVQPGRGRFVDPAHGDYRLRVGSYALDYAPAVSVPDDIDLNRFQRDIDFQNVSANTRARDVGGYERQLSERWVPNGNFVSDLRHWSIPEPTFATWTDAFNVPGSAGGALNFIVPAANTTPTDRRTAASFCFNVPSGGNYLVSGRALAPGTGQTSDYPILVARVRYNAEDCGGPIANTVEAFFGRSASTWQPTTVPLVVTVDPAQWTWNTTIEVRLDVAQNTASPTLNGLSARYDEIEVSKPGAVDTIFVDSFE